MPGDSCEGELAEICTQGVCTEGLCPDAAKDEACASPFLYDDISNDHPPCELGLTCDQSLAQSIVGTAGGSGTCIGDRAGVFRIRALKALANVPGDSATELLATVCSSHEFGLAWARGNPSKALTVFVGESDCLSPDLSMGHRKVVVAALASSPELLLPLWIKRRTVDSVTLTSRWISDMGIISQVLDIGGDGIRSRVGGARIVQDSLREVFRLGLRVKAKPLEAYMTLSVFVRTISLGWGTASVCVNGVGEGVGITQVPELGDLFELFQKWLTYVPTTARPSPLEGQLVDMGRFVLAARVLAGYQFAWPDFFANGKFHLGNLLVMCHKETPDVIIDGLIRALLGPGAVLTGVYGELFWMGGRGRDKKQKMLDSVIGYVNRGSSDAAHLLSIFLYRIGAVRSEAEGSSWVRHFAGIEEWIKLVRWTVRRIQNNHQAAVFAAGAVAGGGGESRWDMAFPLPPPGSDHGISPMMILVLRAVWDPALPSPLAPKRQNFTVMGTGKGGPKHSPAVRVTLAAALDEVAGDLVVELRCPQVLVAVCETFRDVDIFGPDLSPAVKTLKFGHVDPVRASYSVSAAVHTLSVLRWAYDGDIEVGEPECVAVCLNVITASTSGVVRSIVNEHPALCAGSALTQGPDWWIRAVTTVAVVCGAPVSSGLLHGVPPCSRAHLSALHTVFSLCTPSQLSTLLSECLLRTSTSAGESESPLFPGVVGLVRRAVKEGDAVLTRSAWSRLASPSSCGDSEKRSRDILLADILDVHLSSNTLSGSEDLVVPGVVDVDWALNKHPWADSVARMRVLNSLNSVRGRSFVPISGVASDDDCVRILLQRHASSFADSEQNQIYIKMWRLEHAAKIGNGGECVRLALAKWLELQPPHHPCSPTPVPVWWIQALQGEVASDCSSSELRALVSGCVRAGLPENLIECVCEAVAIESSSLKSYALRVHKAVTFSTDWPVYPSVCAVVSACGVLGEDDAALKVAIEHYHGHSNQCDLLSALSQVPASRFIEDDTVEGWNSATVDPASLVSAVDDGGVGSTFDEDASVALLARALIVDSGTLFRRDNDYINDGILSPAPLVSLVTLVDRGGLKLLVRAAVSSATSVPTRYLAGHALALVLARMEDRRCTLPSRWDMSALLRAVRGARVDVFSALPTVTVEWFSDAVSVLSRPDHDLYMGMCEHLHGRALFNTREVPMFPNSLRPGAARRTRLWMLFLLERGLRTPVDANLYRRRHVFSWICAHHDSPILGTEMVRDKVRLILQAGAAAGAGRWISSWLVPWAVHHGYFEVAQMSAVGAPFSVVQLADKDWKGKFGGIHHTAAELVATLNTRPAPTIAVVVSVCGKALGGGSSALWVALRENDSWSSVLISQLRRLPRGPTAALPLAAIVYSILCTSCVGLPASVAAGDLEGAPGPGAVATACRNLSYPPAWLSSLQGLAIMDKLATAIQLQGSSREDCDVVV